MDEHEAQGLALLVAPLAASAANYCDHVEHNELADRDWILLPAAELRRLATSALHQAKVDAIDAYAERLGAIEARNVLVRPGSYDGHRAVLESLTWRELQLVQVEHDRFYHPDVVGLSKLEQLRHYVLHLTKLVGALAEPAPREDLLSRRLPDMLLFGVKLSTVMGARLADEPLPRFIRQRQPLQQT